MSIDSALGGVQSITTAIGSASNLATRIGQDLTPIGPGVPWVSTLQPASYRGVPFGVLGGGGQFGRRNAVHEYPFRDKAWVEDLGKSARRITLSGFLVENPGYGGTKGVVAQREQMIAAAEAPGDGELVHPTLGRMTVSTISFSTEERWDQGRVFEIHFSFIESGARIFPSVATSTKDATKAAAAGADSAAKKDFLSSVAASLQQGAAVVAGIASKAAAYGRMAQRLANDATNLYNMVGTLGGQIGRFFSQAGIGGNPGAQVAQSTIPALIAAGSVSRLAVSSASDALAVNAAGMSANTAGAFADSAQALAGALYASCVNPVDAMRLLASLSVMDSGGPASSSATSAAISAAQGASGDLFRRAAIVAMARASANYVPLSSNSAARVRATVCAALDAEISIAGDQGQDATFGALRALRAAVAFDLGARGAALAEMIDVTSGQPLPAPVLAQRLYRDPGRADELVGEANPIHPAFMPVRFKALST